jgi:hypothetical protein
LQTTIHDKRPEYIGKRQVTRLCSDAYGKGIVRSNQESINLRIGGNDANVTSAESFHTASFVNFPGRDLTKWREAVYQNADYVEMLGAVTVDWRNPHRRTPVMRNMVFLYGHRNRDWKDLWHLSPYEFMVYWTIAPAEYPLNRNDNDDPAYHAELTEAGQEKLKQQKEDGGSQKLEGGRDYVIKKPVPDCSGWAPLPENEHTQAYRHDWILQRNTRPKDPTFAACPMPRRGENTRERNAALVMTYFHAFTLNPSCADDQVPFLGDLCQPGRTWHDTMLKWFDCGVGCQETKRYIDNFFAVTRTRPDDEADEGTDNDLSDDELLIGAANFEHILKTRMGSGAERKKQFQRDAEDEDVAANGGEQTPVCPIIKQAFDSAHDMWKIPETSDDFRQPSETQLPAEDLKKALAAATASRNNEYHASFAVDENEKGGSLRAASGYSAKEVWAWFSKKQKARNSQD